VLADDHLAGDSALWSLQTVLCLALISGILPVRPDTPSGAVFSFPAHLGVLQQTRQLDEPWTQEFHNDA
jgi:hypothetical protein